MTEAERAVNWGIIGLGNIAHRFCRSLRNIEEGRLYAVASHKPEKRQQFKEEFGAERLYDDYSALLQDENVDIVYIAVPHRWHYQWVMEALRHGKNVLCEKPAVVSCREAEEIFALAAEKNLMYMEAMKTRFMPLVAKIHELLDQNQIGEIRYMEVHFTAHYDFPEDHYIWDRRYGGCFYDMGCYGIASITDYIHDDPVGVDVSCRKKKGVDSHTLALCRFASGAEALCESAFNDRSNKRFLLIRGTRGTIEADNFYRPASLTLKNDEGQQRWEEPYGDDDFQYEIRYVHDCLHQGIKESPLMSRDSTMRYVRLMEMIRERIDEAQ